MKFKGSPMVWVSFAMIVGVMGTALISPLYALYKDAWQLQASDISTVYVIYMSGALLSLLFFGRLPDRIGFRAVMQVGLVLVLLGTLITLLSWDVMSLTVGRFVVGLASSLLVTSTTAGFARLSPPGQLQRVAVVSGFLMAFGFGLGPLVGGVIGQWVPRPLFFAFVPTLVLGVCGLIAISKLELPAAAQVQGRKPLAWADVLPTLTWPKGESSRAFVLTCSMPFLAFGVFGLYASMAPLFLDKLVPWHGPIVSGTAIAVILFASAGVQMLAARMPTHWCGFFGLLALALSNAVLMWNLRASSAGLFAFGVLLTSIGHGMSSLAGISMVNRMTTLANRSGLMSTYLVIGYIGSMVPMMGMGWIADHWGMPAAINTFCSAVVVLGVLSAVLFQRHPMMRPRRG